METSAEIRKRFGDEQSNLLDQFERMSFEAHLNRAMLGRSLSEPSLSRLSTLQPLLTHQVNQGRRRSRPPRRASATFHKLLNKLFKPILRRNTKPEPPPPPPQHPLSCKAFSTSLRF
ncbi:hypothetical protein K1719_043130 [Acacia pycnantha]|nr:hypothetical protein K1719_043130 [Acacia pycnantha]